MNLVECPEVVPTLAHWHHAEWSHYNPGQTIIKRLQQMQVFLGDSSIPSTWVAMNEGKVVGSAAIVANDMETHPELSPWLASVYVKQDERCHGIGTRLVEHAMQQARYTDIDTLYLFTPDRQNFYQRLGWQVMHTERYHGHDVVIMSVKL